MTHWSSGVPAGYLPLFSRFAQLRPSSPLCSLDQKAHCGSRISKRRHWGRSRLPTRDLERGDRLTSIPSAVPTPRLDCVSPRPTRRSRPRSFCPPLSRWRGLAALPRTALAAAALLCIALAQPASARDQGSQGAGEAIAGGIDTYAPRGATAAAGANSTPAGVAATPPGVSSRAAVGTPRELGAASHRDANPIAAAGQPDLALVKRHASAFTQGQNGTYEFVVTNVGADPTTGAITVTDTLPAGLGYVAADGTN